MSSTRSAKAEAKPAKTEAGTSPDKVGSPESESVLDRALREQHADIEAALSRAAEGDTEAASRLDVWRALGEQARLLIPPGASDIDVGAGPKAYEPVGAVRVIAETDTGRVLEDDVRRWVEVK